MTAPKRKALTSHKKSKGNAEPRRRADWEAVERDYRTGKFTLRELEAKHGVSYAEISRQSKKRQWKKDLADVIRQATNAALLHEAVTEAQKDATETVLVAAELNKQVILGHREDIKSARNVAADLLTELQKSAMLAEHQDLLAEILAGPGATPKDEFEARKVVVRALDLGGRIGGIKALADTFTKLQTMERLAFNLDADAGNKPVDQLAQLVADLMTRRSAVPVAEEA